MPLAPVASSAVTTQNHHQPDEKADHLSSCVHPRMARARPLSAESVAVGARTVRKEASSAVCGGQSNEADGATVTSPLGGCSGSDGGGSGVGGVGGGCEGGGSRRGCQAPLANASATAPAGVPASKSTADGAGADQHGSVAISGGSAAFRYRKDIDGLRCVAVLAVILNHSDEAWVPGGFIGVDIFFVISGYVVTASLLRKPAPTVGHYLSAFYARRVKRLAPSLTLVVLVSTLALALLVPPWTPRVEEYYYSGIIALCGFANVRAGAHF